MPWNETSWFNRNPYFEAAQQRHQEELDRFKEGKKLLSDVMGLFQNNGAYDQSYANAKNQFMAKSASDMVSRGMGNLVNMPALNLAYEREARPGFEMGKQSRLAQAMSAMAAYIGNFRPTPPEPFSSTTTMAPPSRPSFDPASFASMGPTQSYSNVPDLTQTLLRNAYTAASTAPTTPAYPAGTSVYRGGEEFIWNGQQVTQAPKTTQQTVKELTPLSNAMASFYGYDQQVTPAPKTTQQTPAPKTTQQIVDELTPLSGAMASFYGY